MIWFWLPEIRGSWAKRIIPLSPRSTRVNASTKVGAFFICRWAKPAWAKSRKWKMQVAKPPRHLHGTSQASTSGLTGKQTTEVENASHLHFDAGCRKCFAFAFRYKKSMQRATRIYALTMTKYLQGPSQVYTTHLNLSDCIDNLALHKNPNIYETENLPTVRICNFDFPITRSKSADSFQHAFEWQHRY